MADRFTQNKLEWLERIATNPALSANAVRVGAILATHFLNRKTGECWPAQNTLAKLMRVDGRTARRAITELVVAGYLVSKRGGMGKPNRYSLASTDRTPMSSQLDLSLDTNDHSDKLTGHLCPTDRTPMSSLIGHQCPTNPMSSEPYEEPLEGGAGAPATDGNSKSKKGTRLPDEWEPSVDDIRAAYADGLTKDEARREFEKFTDYWRGKPGAGGVKLDWRATFRNWMRKAADDKREREQRARRMSNGKRT
jgi:hypothetical protein